MAEIIAGLSWIDTGAIAIVLLFFVLGLFRGLVWQVSRVATIVTAYFVAGWFGARLARVVARVLPESAAAELSRGIAYFLIFLLCLILLGTIATVVHNWVRNSQLSFYNRIGGGLAGVATGWLIVMALLTALHVGAGAIGLGSEIAASASRSRSQLVSDVVLARTSKMLPTEWRPFTEGWRELLRGDLEQKTPGRTALGVPESPSR